SNQAADRIENALAVGHRPLSDDYMGAQRLQDEWLGECRLGEDHGQGEKFERPRVELKSERPQHERPEQRTIAALSEDRIANADMLAITEKGNSFSSPA